MLMHSRRAEGHATTPCAVRRTRTCPPPQPSPHGLSRRRCASHRSDASAVTWCGGLPPHPLDCCERRVRSTACYESSGGFAAVPPIVAGRRRGDQRRSRRLLRRPTAHDRSRLRPHSCRRRRHHSCRRHRPNRRSRSRRHRSRRRHRRRCSHQSCRPPPRRRCDHAWMNSWMVHSMAAPGGTCRCRLVK